jgi:hypothetical protein
MLTNFDLLWVSLCRDGSASIAGVAQDGRSASEALPSLPVDDRPAGAKPEPLPEVVK